MSKDPRAIIYRVPQRVLDDSRDFLRARGAEGHEGTALWIGRPCQVTGDVDIVRLFVPDQIAIRTLHGVAVDLTPEAHYTLTDNLGPRELFFCRIHSHPEEAFHSRRDDANSVITHQGAISIVVPHFARAPLDLAGCAIYQLEHGSGWLRLSSTDVARRFQVQP